MYNTYIETQNVLTSLCDSGLSVHLLSLCKSTGHTYYKERSMTTQNKGGRPTKEEALAKSVDKTELEVGLRILKRAFGPALNRMLTAATTEGLSPAQEFKMAQDIVNTYVALLKADKALKAADDDGVNKGSTDQPTATVFQLHG